MLLSCLLIYALFSISVTESPIITDPCVPSPCGANAECRNNGGVAACSCLPTYLGRPPNCRPECVTNSECNRDKACVQQRCIDPCVGICGFNAECTVTNHNPLCTCPPGYRGDPFVQCTIKPSSKLSIYILLYSKNMKYIVMVSHQKCFFITFQKTSLQNQNCRC